jgi:tryptophan halogenase
LKKRITIVGGGTAGWLTALHINKLFDGNADITLIESSEIGILGAGEGAVPHLLSFLQNLDIDINEVINETNGSHKIGVSFENWNGDGKKYIHEFFSLDTTFTYTDEYFAGYLLSKGIDLNSIVGAKLLAYSNKTPLSSLDKPLTGYSIHFDSHLMAGFLKKKALERGINLIEGIVTEIGHNNLNYINALKLQSNEIINTDFVFDCSGFKRLVIGKFYEGNWISYKDKLRVNTALPFQLPQSNEYINPYTKAIAMKFGWLWQIPLQNRIGCGYLFDGSLIDIESAKIEIQKYFNTDIQFGKPIKFEAGYYSNTWINNCIAIGLSAGFSEPLEATSLLMTTYSLELLKLNDLKFITKDAIQKYNMNVFDTNADIIDFLQFHYFTKRNDSEFWNDNYLRANQSIQLMENAFLLKESMDILNNPISLFTKYSWTLVAYGIGYIEDNMFVKKYELSNDKQLISEYYEWYYDKVIEVMKTTSAEIDYLKMIKL